MKRPVPLFASFTAPEGKGAKRLGGVGAMAGDTCGVRRKGRTDGLRRKGRMDEGQ